MCLSRVNPTQQKTGVERKKGKKKQKTKKKKAQKKIRLTIRCSFIACCLPQCSGVPAVVDLAAMRDGVERLGGQSQDINPSIPVDLVIDHSVQVDVFRDADAVAKNQEIEFKRNYERFKFLKWGAQAFDGLTIVPPGAGIVHQVNLEYLARSVFNDDGLLYPDSLVGTDSHTVMINGLGVVGWGVGGLEAESAICGQALTIVMPQVIGMKLTGDLDDKVTATDLVLTITETLRKKGVVGKFVEFYGPGVAKLPLSTRATISNMAPEYGSTIGWFAVDDAAIDYLRQTGRSEEQCEYIEAYLRAQKMFRTDESPEPVFSDTIELDLASVVPSLAGPKRPHDRVALSDMKADFAACLDNDVGFKGFAVPKENQERVVKFTHDETEFELSHGSVVIAAITSCTNTSNPEVMIGAALLARNAVAKGLTVPSYIKTSLAPGSGVVTSYLEDSGLQGYLDQLGFQTVGYGCTTCIGNSGDLPKAVEEAIIEGDLVVSGVLSGNRNFEGRIHQYVPANYLASPPLVVAYALAKTTQFDFDAQPLGQDQDGNDVFLADIWPSRAEIQEVVGKSVVPEMFKEVYSKVTNGTEQWNALDAGSGNLYEWDESSTYIHNPPFFQEMKMELTPTYKFENAYALLNLGDSITTDHISPAGAIAKDSPAARYLMDRGVERKDFNSYGSRRGNDEVMARGTFANVRLLNKFIGKAAPKTVHVPSGDVMDVFDAAMRYQEEQQCPLIVLGGAAYGSGSSRDWAAKGVYLQGVKAVIATSYERIHRSNLAGMGVLPLEFKEGEDAESLGLSGEEQFTIELPEDMTPGMDVTVQVSTGAEFTTTLRLDTPIELEYFKHGGILHYVIRKVAAKAQE
eukprot:TRINITY_DN1200_c0_g1_i1.p1 TRINITY_DN1200_c0_g1~~TRINITY_DN1200_c0_g1_i1.p1  ORF type:complete len:856 (-),score=303.98 TRINITY_DN1200_c0_g1_i1:25-2592(-)